MSGLLMNGSKPVMIGLDVCSAMVRSVMLA